LNTSNRIAFFLPSLAGGGAERVFVHLSNQFVLLGREVDMVLLRKEGPYLPSLDSRVRVVDLASSKLSGVVALARYLRREKPTVLISGMDVFNMVALLAVKLARLKTPTIVTIHLHLSTYTQSARRLHVRLLPFLAKNLYKSATAVVAVSSGVADDLASIIDMPRARIAVVYNPVAIPQIAPGCPHTWFAPPSCPVLVSAGRLDSQKDFITLIRAFSQVVMKRPVRLIILGEGPEREALERLINELGIAENVLLPGFVENPFAYFAHAQLFVLSARYEGFGMVIAEALACGCPVVSTDCPSGPAEILENGRYGTLVPIANPAAMAQAIERALDEPADKAALRKRAADFAPEPIARRYLQIVDRCIQGSDRAAVPICAE